MSELATPVFLKLLANRQGKPGGLLFCGSGEPALPVELRELAVKLPCFYRQQLDGQLAAGLAELGFQRMQVAALQRSDTELALQPEALWVEGDWPLRAPARSSVAQAASRATALQLVQLVVNDAATHEIEDILRRDPTLSYQLLKLVNSLAMGAGRKVTSFSQAILILGRQQLRRWLNLMLFAARSDDVRSPMLLARVAVRARTMELLARETGLGKQVQEQAFMAGMFSLLGVLFGVPLGELLAPLNLGDATQRALLAKSGELGELLALVEAAEHSDLVAVAMGLEALQLPALEFNRMVVAANLWMLEMTSEMSGHG
ncbi:HDOD domain-containing protein [Pseudoduganella eburnea]|uniref:HDOD domain-containing protein n=1 Tax=Massilia eburnea TaxID=1776165 RepID=A0A6L6QNM6_9BURK|nr:HDOD domain-containing protein [Massilia eburnea]MTW13969.1 HDOD domain-containing protein [Massilia eburnea]